MKTLKLLLFGALTTFATLHADAQELKIPNVKSVIAANELPTYIIISSQKGEFFNDIAIIIDSKNSYYAKALEELEDALQSGKKLKIRNQSDLLNAMDQLGFDYLNAYADQERDSYTSLDKTARRYRMNMVFKKKEKYRNEN